MSALDPTVIFVGDYVRGFDSGDYGQVISGLRYFGDVLGYEVVTSRGVGAADGLSIFRIDLEDDSSLCYGLALEAERKALEAREIARRHEEDQKSPAQKVAEENRRIWAAIYPTTLVDNQRKLGGGIQSEASIDDDDWRPTFLREIPKEIDEEIRHTATVNIPESTYVCCNFRHDVRCSDEVPEEYVDQPWFMADGEKQEPEKVTDGLLAAWHRRRV